VKQSTPWIVALLASVLINGALIGFVLNRTSDLPSWTHAASDGPPPRRREQRVSAGFNMRGFVHALPEDRRHEANQRIREEMQDMRDLAELAHVARQDAEAVMTADPFVREDALLAMEAVRQSRLTMERRIESLVIELVEGLPADQRAAAFAAGRRNRADGRPPHRRMHDGNPDGRRGPPRPDRGPDDHPDRDPDFRPESGPESGPEDN
jgi:uncharacterized membrane protein